MTTIKSFTDLSQSKTLSKILPLESADMHYATWTILDGQFIVSPNQGSTIESLQEDYGNQIIPCWSLASLLEEIPETIDFEDDESDYALEILKESGLYYLSYGNPLENGKIEIEPQENFVDACYEMILKLHELKML